MTGGDLNEADFTGAGGEPTLLNGLNIFKSEGSIAVVFIGSGGKILGMHLGAFLSFWQRKESDVQC